MTFDQLLHKIETIDVRGDQSVEIEALEFDSRRVGPGCLFVALPGSVVDGHDFVQAAIDAGAAALLLQRPELLRDDVPCAAVADTHAALALIAHRFYGDPTARVRLIGITGTNGKTSVVYQLEAMLEQAGRNVGVIGTVNYRYGGRSLEAPNTTPNPALLARTIDQMARAGVQDVIVEVSSHGLELGRVNHCRFDVGAFTNLSRDHLDFHGSMRDYLEAKALLFTRLLPASSKASKAVILIDSDEGLDLARRSLVPVLRVSAVNALDADLALSDARYGLDGLQGTFRRSNESYEVHSPLLGAFVGPNLAVAAGLALSLGLSMREVLRGADGLAAVPGRLEPVPGSRDPLVLVDYAHTDGALSNVLAAVRNLARGRVITVFGCGGDRDRGKRPLMGRAAAQGSDLTIVTSDNPRTEDPLEIIGQIVPGIEALGVERRQPQQVGSGAGKAFCVIVDRAEAIRTAVELAQAGDVVLIAGKGHEDYQIVGRDKRHFDDREQAAGALVAAEGPR
ncbi:MAG: UDP-N-acetylmuramoyl-L-alanyl-D-glutamate--2,6-diaminopimelate ligase [Candidatus Alcyoniella australis]|nr:UDP-N-acetylmuramoyl-L-alanyl-D-glutamate--2,6-diaminopimelate ligase [Candidatus Alcyoniella australis]